MFQKRTDLLDSLELPDGPDFLKCALIAAKNIIIEAEDKFGKRIQNKELSGIELVKGIPHNYYSACGKYVIMKIADYCLHDRDQAIFQIAHECVHLLSEVEHQTPTFLEEGLAVVFSEDFVSQNLHSGYIAPPNTKYALAAQKVRILLEKDPEIIKKLRKHEPVISKISKKLIIKEIECSEGLAEELSQIF